MLEVMLSSKAPRSAREWLDANPAHAVAGLVPLTAGLMNLLSVAAAFANVGHSLHLWTFVLPHGVIELTAICIAGGAGFLLAVLWTVFTTAEYPPEDMAAFERSMQEMFSGAARPRPPYL